MRAIILAAALVVSGCGLVTVSDADNASEARPVAERPEVVSERPMAWSYGGTSAAPTALYGVAQGQPTLALTCDREGQLMRLRYATASSAPDTRLVIAVGGQERLIEAEPVPGGLEGELLLADPLFGGLGEAASRFLIAAGSEPALSVPGGPAIRRTVNACRRPEEVRLTGAVFAGLLPCADCPGVEAVLTFEGPEPGSGRYRFSRDYRDGRPPVVETGMASIDARVGPGAVRLDPEGGGQPTLLDQANAGLLLRDADGNPDPVLDRFPLTRRR